MHQVDNTGQGQIRYWSLTSLSITQLITDNTRICQHIYAVRDQQKKQSDADNADVTAWIYDTGVHEAIKIGIIFIREAVG